MEDIIKSEGDYKEWTYQTRNGVEYRLVIRRNSSLGFLCGYIEVTKDNKLFGDEYISLDLNVHGGLTYGSKKSDDVFVYGFDCGHFGDMIFDELGIKKRGDIYRDMNYVTKECEKLAEQFSEWSISAERNKKIDSLV